MSVNKKVRVCAATAELPPTLVLTIPAGEIVRAGGLPGRHSCCSKVCPNSASHVLRTATATSLGTRASSTA